MDHYKPLILDAGKQHNSSLLLCRITILRNVEMFLHLTHFVFVFQFFYIFNCSHSTDPFASSATVHVTFLSIAFVSVDM